MSDPSKQVIDFTNKVYDDIDNDRFGFDPLLVMAIANIIINVSFNYFTFTITRYDIIYKNCNCNVYIKASFRNSTNTS